MKNLKVNRNIVIKIKNCKKRYYIDNLHASKISNIFIYVFMILKEKEKHDDYIYNQKIYIAFIILYSSHLLRNYIKRNIVNFLCF